MGYLDITCQKGQEDPSSQEPRPALTKWVQVTIGLSVFLLGLTFYIFYRSGVPIFHALGLQHIRAASIFFSKTIWGSLPSFIHVLSFSIITAGILTNSRLNYFISCSTWILINFIFEFGQLYKGLAISMVPSCMTTLPLIGNAQDFFRNGAFDAADLCASALGGIAAYVLLCFTTKEG